MEVKGFPTSSDIYLELDGKKVAVVQSYTAKANKVIEMMTTKVANGESLSNEETDLLTFYQQMLSDVNDIMLAVSAD